MPKPPSITVWATPPELYPVFIEQLEEQLPLRSVKWWDATEKKTNLIPELPLKIVKHRLPSAGGAQAARTPTAAGIGVIGSSAESLAAAAAIAAAAAAEPFGGDPVEEPDRPLVHVAVVQCDDSSAYRNQLKERLSEWQASLSVYRSAPNWLIVNVSAKALPKGKQRLSLFDTVYDKIKADFGGKTDADRCLQLRAEAGPITAELWVEVLGRLETELLSSFKVRAEYLERLIKASTDAFVDLPEPSDTDFCIFFLLKDTLGRAFESLGLLQQAVAQYDELERLFEQYLDKGDSLRNGTARSETMWLTWFHAKCRAGCVQGAPIGVELDGANFRMHVRSKNVVVFEMRQYILHRQTSLLFALGEPTEAAHRCFKLVLQIVPEMYADWPAVRVLFVRQWAVLTCLDVIRCAEAYLRQGGRGLQLNAKVKYALLRANLAMYAKQRLEEIGVAGKLLPTTFFLGLPPVDRDTNTALAEEDVALPAGEVMFPDSSFPALRIMRTCGELLPSLNTGIESAAKAAATALQRSNSGLSGVSPRRPKNRAAGDDESVVSPTDEAEETAAHRSSRFTRRKSTRTFCVAAISSRPSLELLQDASRSVTAFDFLYMNLSQVAVDSFKQADRMRSSLSLFCDMAALQYCRGEWVDAADQFAVAVRQFRKDCWFELEYRLLRPMVHCYEQIGAHDLVVDTILRMLSEDCPTNHIAEQDIFAGKLHDYAQTGAESVTCDANNIISVISIAEVPSTNATEQKLIVKIRNHTATCLLFDGVTLTYEEAVKTPTSSNPFVERISSSKGHMPSESTTTVGPPDQTRTARMSVVSEVDLTSPPMRRQAIAQRSGNGAGQAAPAPSSDDDGEGLDTMTEDLFYDQSEAREWLHTRRTQAQRERDFSYTSEGCVSIPPGATVSFGVHREGERYGGQFIPRTLVLCMKKVTLLCLHLPACREVRGTGIPLDIHATLEPPTFPLIRGLETDIVICVAKLGEHHEADVLTITAGSPLQLRLTGRDDKNVLSTTAELKMTAAREAVTLSVVASGPPAIDNTVDVSEVSTISGSISVVLSNTVTSPRESASAKVDLVFGVPLRAKSDVRTIEGRAYLRVELMNQLQSEITLRNHSVTRAEGDPQGSSDDPVNLNGFLQWPLRLHPKQLVSFAWLIPSSEVVQDVNRRQWPDIFRTNRHHFKATFEACLAVAPESSASLLFYHMMEYFEPVYHFLADLTPQVRAGATTHTVGEFAPFRLQISCMRMVPIDVDGDAPGAVHLTYSLAVDSKRWMCSGQIRGKIIMKPDDEGVIMEQAILLLPLVSGLLHLPTIKVHCEVDGDIKAIPVNNRHRAHQVRIFPQTSKPATTRLSVY
mmetsp:Transcript_31805/g.95623  ORF Transcript_31805/g.95623 Transcript_31805/m.95623 type:complete len:1345 (+) Transcript_31805:226-4260(+)